MISFTKGNLLDADVEALVNTVNEVGVMGKGIALMFKEAFPDNFQRYDVACKNGEVAVGKMFVTRRDQLDGPRRIINFPTKKHWRTKTKIEWITSGLADLRRVIEKNSIKSIAIPPLGSGNGGLDWSDVRPHIVAALDGLSGVEVVIYEPTRRYQNVSKRAGVKQLTPARALILELIRRYSVLGFECSLLEVQKLAWFFERYVKARGLENPMRLGFDAGVYGPYAIRLGHLLNSLDGSYLQSDKRIPDAKPTDLVRFNAKHRDTVAAYLRTGEARQYIEALDEASMLVDGFESPMGMELLSTVDWLIHQEGKRPTLEGIREGITKWPAGTTSASRKTRMFSERHIELALRRLLLSPLHDQVPQNQNLPISSVAEYS